ncbi:MAG: AAA family ATPase [Schwartzia sp.]|nr:AAA family ATPase [Schwartzia sp. (in: firmicutes)]
MKIRRVIIENYRNLKSIDVTLGPIAILIGENNSSLDDYDFSGRGEFLFPRNYNRIL